jgi:hypothetical protein
MTAIAIFWRSTRRQSAPVLIDVSRQWLRLAGNARLEQHEPEIGGDLENAG